MTRFGDPRTLFFRSILCMSLQLCILFLAVFRFTKEGEFASQMKSWSTYQQFGDCHDMDKCKALFEKGKLLDTPSSLSSNWQPRGCMLYNYQSNDIQSCLREQTVVFIGDSTTRQVFLALARKLNHE